MSLKVLEKTQAAGLQQKKVVQSIAQATAELNIVTERVDEFIGLQVELDALEAKFKRRDELKKEFAALANEEFDDDDVAVFHGNTGDVKFSARTKTRQIDNMNELIGRLKDKVGYEGLLKLLKLTLGDCEKYLSKEELKPFLSEVRGSRSFKGVTVVVPK